MRKYLVIAFAIFLYAAGPAHAHETESRGSEKKLTAGLTDDVFSIDGQLQESAWETAPSFDDMVERKPKLGTTPENRTIVKVLSDGTWLYIGAECHDLRPEEVRGRTMTRDSFSMFSDDAISVKIDPAHDHRTTYGFAVNVAGAKLDYKAVNESNFMKGFDTIWDGAAQRTDYGWSAEFKIPLAVLGFEARDLPVQVGLNISRDHSRRSATYDWSVMPPPYNPVAAGLFGHLTLPAPAPATTQTTRITNERDEMFALAARGYRFAPYVLTGFQQNRPDGENSLKDPDRIWDVGLDGSTPVGDTFTSHFTINTDFAQVDVDDQVVNLSRFGLFLPEKRDFFLRDSEIFAFGQSEKNMLFHSRRVGLNDGTPIPILAGHKLTGQATKSLRVGFLNVATEAHGDLPWTGNMVWRALNEFDYGSNAGVMITHRQSLEDPDNFNTVVGVDGSWRSPHIPLVIDAFGLLSQSGSVLGGTTSEVESAGGAEAGTDEAGSDLQPGFSVEMMWRGALVRPRIGYNFFPEDFRADLGFFRRVGVHEAYSSLTVEPRIERYSIEKVTLEGWGSMHGSPDGQQLLDWSSGAAAGISWDQGFRTWVYLSHQREDTQEDFEVGSATIPSGHYEMTQYFLYATTPYTFWIGSESELSAGDYYGGDIRKLNQRIFIKPSAHFRLEAGGLLSRVTFDDDRGAVDAYVVNTRATVGFSPTLGLDYYVGWDHQAELLVSQGRLRWEFASDSALFLVYQENLDEEITRSDFRSVQLKATFGWPGGARR